MNLERSMKRWARRKLSLADKAVVIWRRVRDGKSAATVEAGRRVVGNVVSGRR